MKWFISVPYVLSQQPVHAPLLIWVFTVFQSTCTCLSVFFPSVCMLSNFPCFTCHLLIFFQKWIFQQKSFRNTIRVSNLGARSGPTFCRSSFGSKLHTNVISRWQKKVDPSKQRVNSPYILEDFENASPYFCTFLANRICDWKVTRRF